MQLNRLAAASFLATALLSITVPVSAYDRSYPLARVAAQLGYTYNYIGVDDVVTLTRPGLTILIRPGEMLFDVNDRTEAMDSGAPPRFFRSDLYISPQFVRRLTYLANKASGSSQRDSGLSSAPIEQPAIEPGAITLDVKPVLGSQTLQVNGHAPAHAPITLTLIGTMAFDMPDVVLNRNGVSADADGNFEAVVPLAPGFFTGAYITLEATSVAGVTKASKRILVPPPNTGVNVPADQDQKSIR